jgi:hypothetical protein
MFDIVLGPAGRDAWNAQNLGRVQFRHEWSQVTYAAGAAVAGVGHGVKDGEPAPAAAAAAIQSLKSEWSSTETVLTETVLY